MKINFFSYKYNNQIAGSRLKFISEQFNNKKFSDYHFHKNINDIYYKHFSNIYHERETSKIQNILKEIQWSNISSFNLSIYDIGSGEGFIFETLSKFNIKYARFYNCDPYQESTSQSEKVVNLRIKVDETIPKLRSELNPSLVSLCSTLHHIIKPDLYLYEIVKALKSDDYLLIAHEPINSYISTLSHVIFTIILRLLRLFISTNKQVSTRNNRYNLIINELTSMGILSKNSLFTPLHIRRLVDYQVGYKFDFLKLSIPKKYNEGYWSLNDTINLLNKNNMELVNIIKYPYFTSENKYLNKLISKVFRFLHLNTQYTILARKI